MRTLSPRVRLAGLTLVTALVVALMPFAQPTPVLAGPIADSDPLYLACGRVFPDPQAFWAPGVGEGTPHPGTGTSPFAKGNGECAAKTFVSYEEAIRGLRYLDSRADTGKFVELIDLTKSEDPRIREVLDEELGDGWSEGLATTGAPGGQRSPLYLVKVTAPEDAVLVEGVKPIKEKKRNHFAWSLSVHGIERAGIEGGLRAIEDLATWGATQPTRRLLETYKSDTIQTVGKRDARNLRVGEVLMNSVSYFMLPNPDGWRRGDLDRAGASFARFNGNGMDLNRDWPEIGYVDPSFTPWSESESRSYGKVLKNLSNKWTGGIDLHGMVAAKAFSFTLIGGAQRPYDKNQRTMQFVEQAWDDASKRLSWSPNIKPNSEKDQCVPFGGVAPTGEINQPPNCDQRMYGVQYGTIWDTINYTATGAIGNWIDSPIGLNADGIDNEMSMSHLGNCGTGNCYLPEFEQLHVDGNKSLIYAMLNFSLQPPPSEFDVDGNVAYFVNPRRLVDPGEATPEIPADAKAPADITGTATHRSGTTVLKEFTVANAKGETFIGGITADVRWSNVAGHSQGALDKMALQYNDPEEGKWVERPVYAPGATYVSGGQSSYWNYPKDGSYRLVLTGSAPVEANYKIDFTTGPAWDAPIQAPFNVSNMDFFSELKPYMADDSTLTGLNVDNVLAGQRNLSDFDTVVIADDALLPGYREEGYQGTQGMADLPETKYTAADRDKVAAALRSFVEAGGNLVLTDDGLRALEWMGLVPSGAVKRGMEYAAAVAFTTNGGTNDTYGDPLAAGVNKPGSAENTNNRKQIAEPLPTGYEIDNGSKHPQWHVDTAAWKAAGGRTAGTQGTGAASANRTTFGEVAVGQGRVRILGGLLQYPTTEFFHPYGLSSYGITDPGFIVTRNMWTWSNPAQTATPNLADDPITWVNSDIPTRVKLAGS